MYELARDTTGVLPSASAVARTASTLGPLTVASSCRPVPMRASASAARIVPRSVRKSFAVNDPPVSARTYCVHLGGGERHATPPVRVGRAAADRGLPAASCGDRRGEVDVVDLEAARAYRSWPGTTRVTTDASTAASRRCRVVRPRLPCAFEVPRRADARRRRRRAGGTPRRAPARGRARSRRSDVVTRPRASGSASASASARAYLPRSRPCRPVRVIEVLPAAGVVDADGLDVAVGIGARSTRPARRAGSPDARMRSTVAAAERATLRIEVAESRTRTHAAEARVFETRGSAPSRRAAGAVSPRSDGQ